MIKKINYLVIVILFIIGCASIEEKRLKKSKMLLKCSVGLYGSEKGFVASSGGYAATFDYIRGNYYNSRAEYSFINIHISKKDTGEYTRLSYYKYFLV